MPDGPNKPELVSLASTLRALLLRLRVCPPSAPDREARERGVGEIPPAGVAKPTNRGRLVLAKGDAAVGRVRKPDVALDLEPKVVVALVEEDRGGIAREIGRGIALEGVPLEDAHIRLVTEVCDCRLRGA